MAIAVDNLTNAQLLGKDEEKEEEERQKHQKEIKEKYAPKVSNDDKRQILVSIFITFCRISNVNNGNRDLIRKETALLTYKSLHSFAHQYLG